MTNSANRQAKKLGRKVLIILCVLIFVPLLLWLFLFKANQFTLEVQLLGEPNPVVGIGEDYVDPGVQAVLRGTIIGRNGIPVNGQIFQGEQPDFSTPGTYNVTYNVQWYQFSAHTARIVTVVDKTPPRITLTSVPGHFTIPGDAYMEEGYSAWDNMDGDLTSFVTRVNDGDYVSYMVMDQAGNQTCVRRKIHYYDPIAPEISLLGDSTVYIMAGSVFSDPGFTALDNVDGDLTDRVTAQSSVDQYLAGEYQVTYTVEDETGNIAEVSRSVIVRAKEIPGTVYPEEKTIYLTFDDGPGPYTDELLAILEKYNAKATFFVVDSKYNHLMADIVKAGHSIGIHSVSHSYKTIYASADAFFQDLLGMQKIIYEETGVETWLMRFPGGSSNTVSSFNPGIMSYLTQAVRDNGFQYFDWNVDSNDAGGAKKAEQVFENVKNGAGNRRVSIVLQHDIKDFSVEAVEKILIWGLENGYQFRGLDMTSPTAHHGVNN